MSDTHRFTVPGRPKVKARPRVRKDGRSYTPKGTAEFEERIRNAYDGPTFEGPLKVHMELCRDLTIITIKKLREEWWSPLTGDVDNYTKTLDALNGIAWGDDRQIMDLRGIKRPYSKG